MASMSSRVAGRDGPPPGAAAALEPVGALLLCETPYEGGMIEWLERGEVRADDEPKAEWVGKKERKERMWSKRTAA